MSSRLTAGAPLGVLVRHLARAGWGDLAGADMRGMRATLRALADLLPAGIASGRVTAPQLAEVAGYSERWMRSRLQLLEDAGVVTWTRGGVVGGRPVPSLIRVHKKVLLGLIRSARTLRDAVIARHRDTQRKRLEGIMTTFRRKTLPGKRAGQPHAEVSTGLPPKGEVSRTATAHSRDRYDIPICRHGGDGTRFDDGIARCPSCRRLEGVG